MRAVARSLRGRLMLVIVVLTASALVAAAVATTLLVRAALLADVDRQLDAAAAQADHELRDDDGGRAAHERAAYPEGTYAELRRGGQVVASFVATAGPMTQDRPRLDFVAATDVASERRVSVPQADDVPGYRVLLQQAGPDELQVTAVPLGGATSTLRRLVVVETVVGTLVLLALVVAAWRAIAVGLRPLTAITSTADAITEGDLSVRAPATDGRGEVGRLARAFNAMLDRVETAIVQRDASERRLRRFVADAGHELRTPLTTVQGYADLISRGGIDGPEADAAVERMARESHRMSGLVDDLLLLAHLDQRRPLRQAPVDLATIVADAVADARTVASDHRIVLDVVGRPVVTGDDSRLRQTVANLVSNATIHTPAGTTVTVRVAGSAQAGILEVRDDGPGLALDDAAHVFERFYRGDIARSGDGSGLGLSIVASIVEAHGGRVQCDSVVGTGATFVVHLPLAPQADPPRARLRAPQPTS